jgi:hypothetical protein
MPRFPSQEIVTLRLPGDERGLNEAHSMVEVCEASPTPRIFADCEGRCSRGLEEFVAFRRMDSHGALVGQGEKATRGGPGVRRAFTMTCSLPTEAPAACGSYARPDDVMAGRASHAAPLGPAGAHGGGRSERHSRDSIRVKSLDAQSPPPSEFPAARRASRVLRRLPDSL